MVDLVEPPAVGDEDFVFERRLAVRYQLRFAVLDRFGDDGASLVVERHGGMLRWVERP